jgi:CheY-like chemotaxis protein
MHARSGAEKPLRVLLVEDNRDARTTLRMLLTMGHGHTVEEAGDGASGVRAAVNSTPDVALVDLGLPDMDGCEVARAIRAATGDAVVLIALTGYASDADRHRAVDAGFDHYLVKPVELPALMTIFDSITAAKRAPGT